MRPAAIKNLDWATIAYAHFRSIRERETGCVPIHFRDDRALLLEFNHTILGAAPLGLVGVEALGGVYCAVREQDRSMRTTDSKPSGGIYALMIVMARARRPTH